MDPFKENKRKKDHIKIIYIIIYAIFFLQSIATPVKADPVDISNITTFSRNTTSAVIRWESNQVAGTSLIEYGTTTAYGINASDEQLSYYHETTLSSLTPGTTYHFRIRSTDYDNNETQSIDYNFTTPTQIEIDAEFAADLAQRRARGNVYFIRIDGNDTCNGNYNLSYEENQTHCAFQTIPHAISTSTSGDSIYIMPGNYTQDSTITITKSNFSLIGIGLPCIILTDNSNAGIFITNTYNVTIDGLCIRNVTRGIYGMYANYLTATNNDIESISTTCGSGRISIYGLHSPNNIVSDNKIRTSGGGISLLSINATIAHNTIDIYYKEDESYCEDSGVAISLDIENSRLCGAAYNQWNATQICTVSNISNSDISYNVVLASNRNGIGPGDTNTVKIHHNLVNNADHNSIDLHGTTNAEVYSNTILNTTQGDSLSILISAIYPTGSTILWDAGGTIGLAKDINIHNNFIHNKGVGGIFNWGNPYNITVSDNIIINEAEGGIAYQGDIYNNYPRICYGVRFINNRISTNRAGTTAGITIYCSSEFPSEPYIPALMNRSEESNIFMDNNISVPNGNCFNLGNTEETIYFINNRFNCPDGMYSYQSGSVRIGSIHEGYYLNIRTINESGYPVSGAEITVESTRYGYNPYSLSGIYDDNGIPIVDNLHLLNTKNTTNTNTDGYSPDATDPDNAIFLPTKIFNLSDKITQPITWKITISKDGYYPKTVYYSVGTDDYKTNLTAKTNAKTITLQSITANKTIIGTEGLSWQSNAIFTNITEDNVTNSLEISQSVDNITSWWKLDQNESLGAFDSVGNNHGIFEELGTNTSWVPGNYRNGLKLTGTEYIRIHNDNIFNADNNTVCMSAWIKPETDWNDATTRNIISETEGNNIAATKQGWFFNKKVVTDGLYLFLTKNTSYNEVSFNELTWTADTWHFVAFCFDQYKAKMWKDDTNRTIMTTSSENPVTGPYSIWIGNSGTNITFDDIRLYNHWLSNDEMTNIKNNAHKSRGTITSVPQISDVGMEWTSIIVNGTVPENTSVSLDIHTSSNGIIYTRSSLSSNTEMGHVYQIPTELQKRYAYFNITLETNDSSVTPTITNVMIIETSIVQENPGATISTSSTGININGTISFTQLYNYLVSVNGEEYTHTYHIEPVESGIWLIKAGLFTTSDPESRLTINSTDGKEFRFGFVHNSGYSSVNGRVDYRDITIKWWDTVNDVPYQLGNRRHIYRDNSYIDNVTWDTISTIYIGERYNYQSNNSVMKNCYVTNWSGGIFVYGDNITIENLLMEDAYFKAGTSGVKQDLEVKNSRFENITIKNIGNVTLGDSTGTYGFQIGGSYNHANNIYVENVRYVCFNIGGNYNTYTNLTAKGGTHNIFEAQANNSIYDTIHISDAVIGHTDSGWFTANRPYRNNTIRNVFIDSRGGGGAIKLATTNYEGPITNFQVMNLTSRNSAFIALAIQDFVFIDIHMNFSYQGFQFTGDITENWITKDITFIDSSLLNISSSTLYDVHNLIMANTEWKVPHSSSVFKRSNYTIMYPIDVNVTDPSGSPIEGATIKFNTLTINGWGQENTTFYTNSNGTIYEQGNRTKKAYIPDYLKDATNGYTYYNITIIARKLNGTRVNTTHIHANIPGTEDTENIIYPDGNIGHYTQYIEGNVTDIDPDSSWYRPDSEIPPQIFNITLNQTKELGEIVSWTVLPINTPLMCTQATNHSITLSTNTSDNPFWLNNTIPDYANKKVTLQRDGTYYRNTTADATGHVSFYIDEEFYEHTYTLEESTGYITVNVINQLGTPAQDVRLYLNYTNTTNIDTKKTYTREFYSYFDEKLQQYVYPSPGSYIFREISTEHAYTISIDDIGYSYNITDIFTTDPENMTYLTLKTIDSKPPEQVTNLASTLHGETWIRWTWSNPDIYDMPSYDFEKVLIFLNGTNIANSTSTLYNVTGLLPGTYYNITLMAADYCGNLNTTMISSIVRTTDAHQEETPTYTPTGGSSSSSSGGSSPGITIPITTNNTKQTDEDNPITGHIIDINTTTDDNNSTATNQTQTDPNTPTDKPNATQPIEEEPTNTIKYIAITISIILASAIIIVKSRKNIPTDPKPLTPQNNATNTDDFDTQNRKIEEITQYLNQIRPIITKMVIENYIDPELRQRFNDIDQKANQLRTTRADNTQISDNEIMIITEQIQSLKKDIENRNL